MTHDTTPIDKIEKNPSLIYELSIDRLKQLIEVYEDRIRQIDSQILHFKKK